MKPKLRKILSFLFIVLSLGIVCYIAFGSNELENAWDALLTLNPYWVAAAVGCFVVNLVSDAVGLYYFLKQQGHPISFVYALFIAVTGMYYSNITPGATGGQPMQIYHLNKQGIPVAIGTSAISIRLLCNQFMTAVPAAILWMINRDFIHEQLSGVLWIANIGWALNFAVLPLIVLLLLNRSLVSAIITFFIRLGAKLHIVKNAETTMLRINTGLDTYHSSVLRMGHHPKRIIVQAICSFVNMLSLMAIPVCLYYAFGESGIPWHGILTLSYLVFVSANYMPLPGGSGAQEGGFLLYFKGVFPAGIVNLALLVWRFFTFYLFIFVGVIVTMLGSLIAKKTRKTEN